MATLSCVTIVITQFAGCSVAVAQEIEVPRVVDAELELTLLASEPEIVTPTGLVADRQGRLYVVESHTHARGTDYEGPSRDRVRVYEDNNGDGRLDRSRIYADGLRHALAAAFSQDEELYVVQMKSVVVLRDPDGDGTSEIREEVLTVETENNNNHGVLLALAFDNENRLYVSLGNVGGHAYTIQGSDGSEVTGQGDTGLIVRCRADGSMPQRFAHGFWNPCDLKFDTAGRLLATDNDPDARGPNRVLHVIDGGEYGYKSRFGPGGLHPYCAWNGELPGTLPMLAGVGEAPVGVLDCKSAALPKGYADDLLVCVWGTNEVVRVRTRRRGASFSGEVEPLIVGGPDFRPTAITATADGSIYIADWADRRYPVHGKGRLWRLATRSGVETLQPQLPFSLAADDAGEERLRQIRRRQAPEEFDQLLDAASDDDPFVASTALTSLSRPQFRDEVIGLLADDQSSRRMVGLLVLKKADVKLDAARLQALLNDQDAAIRKLTLIWLGESMRMDLTAEVRESLPLQSASADLFETFLATSQLLTESELAKVRQRTPGSRIDRNVDQDLIRAVIANDKQPPAVTAMALRYLRDVDHPETVRRLIQLSQSADGHLAIEAVRTLSESQEQSAAECLRSIAHGTNYDSAVRCAAVMSYAALVGANPDELLPLLNEADQQVALTAARALTGQVDHARVRAAFEDIFQSAATDPARAVAAEQIRFALKQPEKNRPETDDQWKAALTVGGDPNAGRRVFFDRRVSCSKCHRVRGRGGRIGPDLSNVAAAKTRDELLDSLLHPSRNKSPDYQGYVVVMKDGRIHKGTQFHFRGESAEMLLEEGGKVRFKLSDTDDFRPLESSLMPDKLVETMSVGEFRDLFAFLETLGDGR